MTTAISGRGVHSRRARRAVAAVTVAAAALLAGCGGGGGGTLPAAVTPSTSSPSTAPLNTATSSGSFTFTGDSYGMQNATYLAATTSGNGVIVRAAVASGMTDPDFKTVARIDIPDRGAVAAGKTYSLGVPNTTSFPGTLYFFNGHQSTLLRTVGGTITFNAYGSDPGDTISGSFSATIVDDGVQPAESYTVSASFTVVSGASGQIVPAQLPVPPAAASVYGARCAACHSLGSIDAVSDGAPELGLRGGRLESLFAAGAAGHKGITLSDTDVTALKVLLNAN